MDKYTDSGYIAVLWSGYLESYENSPDKSKESPDVRKGDMVALFVPSMSRKAQSWVIFFATLDIIESWVVGTHWTKHVLRWFICMEYWEDLY